MYGKMEFESRENRIGAGKEGKKEDLERREGKEEKMANKDEKE